MKTFILIAFFSTGSAGGAAISQEFNTKATCEKAKAAILQWEEEDKWERREYSMAFCVPK